MLIPVVYPDGKHDQVKDFLLTQLISDRTIIKFRRSQGWIDIDAQNIRKTDPRSVYFGRERRNDMQETPEFVSVL